MTRVDSRTAFRQDLLESTVVLVTGGGSGIGRRCAVEAAALGATVVVGGRRAERLQSTVDEIRAVGGQAHLRQLDVRRERSVTDAMSWIADTFGSIDGVINSAGGQFAAPAAEITPNGWRAVVDLNLTGAFLVAQGALHASMAAGGGSIVFVSGGIALGAPFVAHTAAAKAGVENLARSLAVEWAAMGVRVNAVAPGIVESSGLDTYPPEIRDRIGRIAAAVPLGRAASEAEVSASALFLLSPAASYLTGQTLCVDGGWQLASPPYLRALEDARYEPDDARPDRP